MANDALVSALLVSAGAVPGALMRYGACNYAGKWGKSPVALCAINVCGSLALGTLVGMHAGARSKALLGAGFCGAFTSFSTFSTDTVRMIQAERYAAATAYVAGTNVLSIGAAVAGVRLGSGIAGSKVLGPKLRAVMQIPPP